MTGGGVSAGWQSEGGWSLRILKAATADTGFPFLQPSSDLTMLLAFVERFDRLGWLPPLDEQKLKLLAAHDVQMHVVHETLCFYEFCSKGARGERDPWLSIFFHVDQKKRVRICGVEPTASIAVHRQTVVGRMARRVNDLSQWLKRRKDL